MKKPGFTSKTSNLPETPPMSISQIKAIDGRYNPAKLTFTLIFEVVSGMPEPGDGLMMWDCIWSIKEIQKMPNGEHYKMITTSDTLTFNNFSEMIKQPGADLMCGFDINTYKLLPSSQKLEYLNSVASLYSLQRVSKFITEHIQLCIAMYPDSNTRPGLSKFGGLPNAPASFGYPKDQEGKSALFIGQINLEEFNHSFECTKQLSGKGMLYFFGTIEVRDNTNHSFKDILVCYSEVTRDLVEIPVPEDIKEYGFFEERNILAVEEISIPYYESTFIYKAGLNEDEVNFYEIFSELVENYNYFQPPSEDYFERIKLMGYPQQSQGCIQIETVFKNLKQGWHNPDENRREQNPEMIEKARPLALLWRHLFSLPTNSFEKLSNFPGEFNKYMGGAFNVMIKQEDLDKMNFDRTECVWQGT